MIKAERISFRYEQESPLVLQDLNVKIEAGQWVAVIGANGSGKSTLARHFNGLLLPETGRVLVDGLDTNVEEELWQARQKVAFVFQNPDNQLVATSVEDDIAFGLENLGLPPSEICQRLEEALAVTGLAPKRRQAPHLLSGGEKQRVAIAGALAMRSAYMVLDEPTSMLDPQLRLSVLATLQKLHQELGLGLIYVTNIMEEALLAQRVLVLGEGRVLKDGTPAQIFSDADWLKERQLALPPACRIAANLAAAGHAQFAGSLSLEDVLEELSSLASTGRSNRPLSRVMPDNSPKKGATSSTQQGSLASPIITSQGLCYAYQSAGARALEALHAIDLTIRQGELVALIGHSGSGKSTLAQLLTGLIEPTAGEICVGGQTRASLPRGAIFNSVGLVFQYPEQQLFAETVFEEVAFGPKNFGADPARLPQLVDKALKDVGLAPELFLQRSPFLLSGGQKRRLSIASVLAMDTEILIFDEPTAGLDAAGAAWMLGLARRLNRQGKTVIWISHNMEEVAELAGRIIVLHQGRILRDGPPPVVFAAEQELMSVGLDIPLAAKLVRRAKASGLAVPGQAITMEGACQELLFLLGGDARA